MPHEFDAVLAVGEAVAEELPAEDGEGSGMGAAVTGEAAQAEDSDRAKRRGRRGGRRRRRDGEAGAAEDGAEDAPAAAAAAYAPPAYVPPVYSGPTPADPFGGGAAFDIFDAIEQAEQQRALAAFAPQASAAVVQPEPEQPALAPATDDAAEARIGGGQVIDEMPLTEPVIVLPEMVSVEGPDAAPVPAEPEPAVAAAASEVAAPASAAAHAEDAAPAVATETPASEPAAQASLAAAEPEPAPIPELAPAIVPILVGEAEPAEKKRGWWKK